MPAQNQQPSFIPKKPTVGGGRSAASSLSMFMITGVLVFILSIAVTVGLFLYKQWVEVQVVEKSDSLLEPEEIFDPADLAIYERVDRQVNSAQTILDKHVAPTHFFALLEDRTVGGVYFSNFSYRSLHVEQDGTTRVNLVGSAPSFAHAVYQEDTFRETDGIRSVELGGFQIQQQDSRVRFNVDMVVEDKVALFHYEEEGEEDVVEDNE